MAALEADPGQGPRVYLLITPKNKELLERANQVLLKLARQDAKDKGKPEPVKTSDHRGVAVHALGGENGIAYGLVAGKLAISNSVKNLERLIDRIVALAGAKPANPRVHAKGRSRHSPSGRNGKHSRRSKMPTRSRGASPIWIDCGSSIRSGTARPKAG